jgi:hypothetical protein
MSLQPLIVSVVVALLVSAGSMAYGVATNARYITVAAALSYALVVLFVAWRVNRPAWFATGIGASGMLFHTMRRNTRLAALVYAWGSTAFFAIYGLTDVRWQHGFQYGTAAALLAAAFLYYAYTMGKSGTEFVPPIRLTVLHGAAVAAGLVFLFAADKLATPKGDWPANYIFLFGGLAIVGLCYIAFVTQIRLRKA